MIFRLLKNESKTIVGAAAIVGVLSFVSRLFGLLRDRILSGAFGAGDTLDAYYAAFKLPDLVFSLVVVGSLSASFIPLFGKHFFSFTGKQKAWDFVSNAVNLLLIAMAGISALLAVFSHPIAVALAPGFPAYKQELVSQFMRVMLVAQVVLAGSAVFASALQGMKRFFAASLAPIFYNVGIIAGTVWFVPVLGPIGLAWGVVFGAVMHFGVQAIALSAAGYSYRPRIDWKDTDTRAVAKLATPRMLAVSLSYISALVFTVIASTLEAGSVTIFQFAYNIQYLPVGIIGISFAVAAFPSFVEKLSRDDKKGFTELFGSSVRQVLFLIVPLTLVFLVVRAQIVRVVVGAGAFDWAATIATADTLAFFALGFAAQCVGMLVARAFFALEDTATPLTIGFVSALLGILTALLLVKDFGVAALGIGFTVDVTAECVLMWVVLRQRIGTLGEAGLVRSGMKIAVAATVAGAVMQFLKPPIATVVETSTLAGIFLQGLGAGGLGLLAYFGVAYFLKSPELAELTAGLRRKVLRASAPEEPAIANPTPGSPE